MEGKSHIEPPKIEKEANIQIYIWNNPAPLFPEVDPLTKSPQEMQEVLDNFENEFSQWRDQIEERLISYEDASDIDKSDKLDQITKEVEVELDDFETILNDFTDKYYKELKDL